MQTATTTSLRVRRALVGLGLATLASAGATACTTTQIYRAQDQGQLPVTQVELAETTYSLFFTSLEHVFLLCKDAGDELVCHRACGANADDLQCPTAITSDGITTSNVR